MDNDWPRVRNDKDVKHTNDNDGDVFTGCWWLSFVFKNEHNWLTGKLTDQMTEGHNSKMKDFYKNSSVTACFVCWGSINKTENERNQNE